MREWNCCDRVFCVENSRSFLPIDCVSHSVDPRPLPNHPSRYWLAVRPSCIFESWAAVWVLCCDSSVVPGLQFGRNMKSGMLGVEIEYAAQDGEGSGEAVQHRRVDENSLLNSKQTRN